MRQGRQSLSTTTLIRREHPLITILREERGKSRIGLDQPQRGVRRRRGGKEQWISLINNHLSQIYT